jgi:ATP-dependent Clp protease ATP-binding subunit ClpA
MFAMSGISRGLLMASMVEAQRRGSGVVEAEHILLALAADTYNPVAAVLGSFGLEHDAILRALETERERSLAAAGMTEVPDPARLASTRLEGRPRWSASIQSVFEHASRGAARAGRQGRHGMTVGDLLYGILSLEFGTVPRALAYAGIDRMVLRRAVMTQAGIPDGDGGRTRRSRLHPSFRIR